MTIGLRDLASLAYFSRKLLVHEETGIRFGGLQLELEDILVILLCEPTGLFGPHVRENGVINCSCVGEGFKPSGVGIEQSDF